MSNLDNILNGVDGSKDIADVSDADDFRLFCNKRLQLIQTELSVVSNGDMLDDDTALHGLQLPGNDVRVVLHLRDENLIAWLHLTFAERAGHQIDSLRRSTGEDNLLYLLGIDKLPYLLTGCFMQIRRLLGEVMHTAVHVGIHIQVFLPHGIEHT